MLEDSDIEMSEVGLEGWSGFIFLNKGKGGGLLQTRQWIFSFYKRR